MNIYPVPITFSMNAYGETIQESRLEILSHEKNWELICDCSLTPDSARIANASKGQIIVRLAYKGYIDNDKQIFYENDKPIRSIGRLSNPKLNKDDFPDIERSLSAYIDLEEAEFLRCIEFVRTYFSAPIGIQIGVWSPEFPEDDIMGGNWDGKPILEILTFSYYSGYSKKKD